MRRGGGGGDGEDGGVGVPDGHADELGVEGLGFDPQGEYQQGTDADKMMFLVQQVQAHRARLAEDHLVLRGLEDAMLELAGSAARGRSGVSFALPTMARGASPVSPTDDTSPGAPPADDSWEQPSAPDRGSSVLMM
eukprot:918439-Prymnesium_polylepis.1